MGTNKIIVLHKSDIHYDEDDAFICKFQRPLFTSKIENSNEILIYNEERDFELVLPLDEEVIEILFPDDEYKSYWLCLIDGNNHLCPIKQIEEQEW